MIPTKLLTIVTTCLLSVWPYYSFVLLSPSGLTIRFAEIRRIPQTIEKRQRKNARIDDDQAPAQGNGHLPFSQTVV